MTKIDISAVPQRSGTIYPPPYDAWVAGRSFLRLGDAGGLTQFGVNIVILAPGAKSSMRHWHENEDEFVMILQGTCIMLTDAGRQVMVPGDCAAFPAGSGDGHCFVNETSDEVRFLVVGSKASNEVAHYPDHGLKVTISAGKAVFTTEDGQPLPDPAGS